MQYTENYQLPQWAEDDRIMMGDFNKAMADIDRGIAAAAKDLGTGGKNARIQWGTYTGNSKWGPGSPSSLQFDFHPLLVYIFGHRGTEKDLYAVSFQWPLIQNNGRLVVTWQDRGITWYAPSGVSGDGDTAQMNRTGYTYTYIVVGVDSYGS